MNPIDDYLEMKKEAGFGDMLRGAWQGFSGGVKPVLQEAQHGLFGSVLGAVPPGKFDAVSRGFALGEKAQVPALAVGGALALAGTVMAIRKIHGAMTKQRDFKQMMQLNPHLADAQAQRPEMFNQAYSSLRKMNPTLTADPLVAGAYMNKMMVLNPEQAGMILVDAAGASAPKQQGLRLRKFGPLGLE
jgi:hypothetical protein